MQDFGKTMGWTRAGLYIGALALAVMGVLCFVAHGIMPEPMHNTGLPEGYTAGGLLGALIMALLGFVMLVAFRQGGGSRYLSGFLILSGIYSVICAAVVLVDPLLGTLSYEWVIAVLIGLFGVILFIEAVFASRVIGYKGWAVQMLLGLVEIVLALAIVYDSANAATIAGIAFFVLAVEVVMIPSSADKIQVAVA